MRRLVLLAAGLALAPGVALPAQARALSTTQSALVSLGYLPSHLGSGQLGPATIAAVHSLQRDRCLDDTGLVGRFTLAQLDAQVSAVQHALGRTRTGSISPADLTALTTWQRQHHLAATGIADGATMAALKVARTRPCGARVAGPILANTTRFHCYPGTINLGVATGYWRGRAVPSHLCAIPGLRSTSAESQPGSAYYVKGANGWAVVNARVSGAFLGLVLTARNSGIMLRANSSFRTMAHQRALCQANSGCRRGDDRFVRTPGWSTHQMGFAVDFTGPTVRGGSSCGRARAVQPSSVTWGFLNRNAHRFGIQQYSYESWHWDATTGSGQC